MRWTSRAIFLAFALAALSWTLNGIVITAEQHDHDATQHDAGAHTHPDAAKLNNPVTADAASIATGKKVFVASCASCHGEAGKGDGKMAASMNPKPPDLTDASWKHGPSDGEMFTVIRDGAQKTPMKGFASKLTSQEIWSTVNYLRSIGPKPSTSQ